MPYQAFKTTFKTFTHNNLDTPVTLPLLLENIVSIEMLKEFLGHSNISSTMVYVKITNTHKIRVMEDVNLYLAA